MKQYQLLWLRGVERGKRHNPILQRQFKRDPTVRTLAIMNSCLQTGYNLSSSCVINILQFDKSTLLQWFILSIT